MQRQTPVCESMGVSNERLNLNLRSTKEDKKKHAHTCTHRIKVIYFPLWRKQNRKVCICISTLFIYSRACVWLWKHQHENSLLSRWLFEPITHAYRLANIVGRCHCKHRNYLLISSQLCAHLRSRLPLPRLSSPTIPSSRRSPQPDERPAKPRRSCRAGRHRRSQLTVGLRSLRVL